MRCKVAASSIGVLVEHAQDLIGFFENLVALTAQHLKLFQGEMVFISIHVGDTSESQLPASTDSSLPGLPRLWLMFGFRIC